MAVHFLTACAGFLLAVLWMDLIFDTQVSRRDRGGEPDEAALLSISGYYRRATTTSRPMSTLIVLVMGILLVALVFESTRGTRPGWVLVLSAFLAGGPILLAWVRTVPTRYAWAGGPTRRASRPAWPGRSCATTVSAWSASARSSCSGWLRARLGVN